ncbi:MAG: hypothetical protein SPK32_07085 [Bacteroidaceae bacterium]|nr:hypothetical protein [Bacteroidaceae bacterium]
MSKREQLMEELSVKVRMLSQRYAETLEQLKQVSQANDLLREENKLLRQDIDSIKSAKVISLSQDNVKNARQEINQLIRQVDKCIALLNT